MTTQPGEDRQARLVAQAYRHQLVAEFALRCAAASGTAELAQVTAEGAQAVAGADHAVVYLHADDALAGVAAADGSPPPAPDDVVLGVARGIRPDPTDRRTTLPIGRFGVLDVVREDPEEQDADVESSLRQLTLLLGVMLERGDRYRRVVDLSEHDPLTGLLNRRRLTDDLATEVELSLRGRGPVAFVLLDVDHFKAVNDRLGHAQGDHVLRLLADAVRAELRAADTAYRYGGEEFAVLLRRTDAVEAQAAADRLREAVAVALSRWRLTISLGIAALPGDAHDVESLVQAADGALYAAKRAGRNRAVRAGTTADGDGARLQPSR